MIGRFRVVLPYEITIEADRPLEPRDITVAGCPARLYPPYQAAIDPSLLDPASTDPLARVLDQLDPAEPPRITGQILLNGSPTAQANVVRLDIHRDEFSRDPENADWPVDEALSAVNEFLLGLRALGRIGWVTSVPLRGALWRFDLLDDHGIALERVEGRIRARNAVSWTWRVASLGPALWEAVSGLPAGFEPSPWHDLLLDASNHFDQIGPPIVLAATAVETRVESAVDILAVLSGVNAELWTWINNRGDYRKEPSVEERADVLLHAVAGRSLKDELSLWESFKNIRTARNSFVHDGEARIGGTAVDVELTRVLVTKATEIVDWFDRLLPPEHRRPSYEPDAELELMRIVIGPHAPPAV